MTAAERFAGMHLVRGGAFRMGSESFYEDERPIRSAAVGDFWMDEAPVTNGQFGHFVRATGYVTFAEIAPDPRNYPGMDETLAAPGSAVFSPPAGPIDPVNELAWWRYVVGADWRHPRGPRDSVGKRLLHPVVHIAYVDAEAYATWAGKSLPTEAEWEYAARGGLVGHEYAWGDELHPQGRRMAKTWEGTFPWRNVAPRGREYTSPVKSYPPNAFGLYDLIGNVWEWTVDDYVPGATVDATAACCGMHQATVVTPARKVIKGGSHLCSPNYCQRYRPAARWPQPIDTTASHVGFRCIIRS